MRASDGPQVVIGVADIEPVSGETEIAARAPALEMVPEPSLALVREPERLELVAEKNDENDEIVPAPEPEPARAAAETAKDVPPASEERTRAYAPAPDESVTPPPVEMAAPTSEKDPFADPDDASIPPVGNVDVEQFFSEGDVAARAAEHHEEAWDALEKAKRKHLPEVVARRSRYARYVRWAVGGAAVVCLAALVRTAVTPSVAASAPKGAAVAALAAAQPAPAEPEPAAPAAAEPAPAAAAPEAKPEETKADEAKPEEPKVEAPKAEAKADDAKPQGAASAAEAKTAAQRALEGGKLDAAIAAGERAVALDPADGEAWLVLGASYQEKGRLAEAQRAYKACAEQGKRGPIAECRAMLR